MMKPSIKKYLRLIPLVTVAVGLLILISCSEDENPAPVVTELSVKHPLLRQYTKTVKC